VFHLAYVSQHRSWYINLCLFVPAPQLFHPSQLRSSMLIILLLALYWTHTWAVVIDKTIAFAKALSSPCSEESSSISRVFWLMRRSRFLTHNT
jgi:hypothetical protein